MPHPLPAPDTLEGALYRDMAEQPLDPAPRLILSDREQEQDLARGGLRRTIEGIRARRGLRRTSLDHFEHLRGATLTEEECGWVASEILFALPKDTINPESVQAIEREVSAALGAPQRGGGMLELLGPEDNLDTQRLRAVRLPGRAAGLP